MLLKQSLTEFQTKRNFEIFPFCLQEICGQGEIRQAIGMNIKPLTWAAEKANSVCTWPLKTSKEKKKRKRTQCSSLLCPSRAICLYSWRCFNYNLFRYSQRNSHDSTADAHRQEKALSTASNSLVCRLEGGVEKKMHQQPQWLAVGANFFQCPLSVASKHSLQLTFHTSQVQKRKKLVEYQTKTRNWWYLETFRPLRGFFSLRFSRLKKPLRGRNTSQGEDSWIIQNHDLAIV